MSDKDKASSDLVAIYGHVQARLEAQRLTTLAVIQARKSGASWSQVAGMLGMTPQGAWQLYHELDSEDPYQIPPDGVGDAHTA